MTLELELEQTVVDAWPALERVDLDGWLLRASGGPTHRGNSVATLAAGSALSLSARIDRVEAWYRERGKPPMLQVGPCAVPQGLDAELAARGYRQEGGALMTLANTQAVVLGSTTELRGEVDTTPSASWLAIAAGASRFASSREVFLGFLERLGDRCRFVTGYDKDGNAAAVCLGIASEARMGVYAMFTLPAYRRRGAARAALNALARDAIESGTSELYLLVEGENLAARGLYGACGFRDVYAYHYRVR